MGLLENRGRKKEKLLKVISIHRVMDLITHHFHERRTREQLLFALKEIPNWSNLCTFAKAADVKCLVKLVLL